MVNCIHMDEKFYPNPEVFDPERFSDENKHKIQPFTFMPFGMGPRNCIGKYSDEMYFYNMEIDYIDDIVVVVEVNQIMHTGFIIEIGNILSEKVW